MNYTVYRVDNNDTIETLEGYIDYKMSSKAVCIRNNLGNIVGVFSIKHFYVIGEE